MADLQYTCPSCAAPIAYDISRALMACDHCLSTFTVEEVEAYNRELAREGTVHNPQTSPDENGDTHRGEDEAAQASPATDESTPENEATQASASNDHARSEAGAQEGVNWEVSAGTTLSAEEDAQLAHLQCNQCGAQIVADPEVISTRCGYCNNTLVAVSRMEATRVPDVIIPFTVHREAMIDAFVQASTGKYLLPPKFRSRHVIREAVGMYVPFWLYDGRAEGTMRFDASNSTQRMEGDYQVTTTSSYSVMRSGGIDFQGIPVCASTHIARDRADAVEPFDASRIVPFKTAYLAGYSAQSYTIPSVDAHAVGEARAIQSLVDFLASSVEYEKVSVDSQDVDFHEGRVTYALLPMWFLNIEYGGKLYRFIINGQTAEVVGEFPISNKRLWRLRLAYFVGGFLGGGALADTVIGWFTG